MIFVELRSRLKGGLLREEDAVDSQGDVIEAFSSDQADHGESLPFEIEEMIISMLDSLPGVKHLGGYAVLIKSDNPDEPASIQVVVNSKFPHTQRFIDAILELEADLNSDKNRGKISSLSRDVYRVFSKADSIPDDDEIISSSIV